MFPHQKIEKTIGIKFKNKALLKNAFIHRSYLNEHPQTRLPSNERLEFLGDAVLELWVSQQIFHLFPHYPEGKLTNLRAQVVCTSSLAQVAKQLNLGQFLLLSKGEEKEGGRKNASLLANTVEALIGALFEDQGMNTVSRFLKKHIGPQIKTAAAKPTFKDYKSLLQELVQRKKKITPEYRLIKSIGPDHQKKFTFGVFIKKKKISEGRGYSKQEAQQKAAQEALKQIKSPVEKK